jgi:hypothetical protein
MTPDDPHDPQDRPTEGSGTPDGATRRHEPLSAAPSTHEQLEQALDLALGGFRLTDQGLELSGGGLVHLLGADGAGRLVLVLLVSEYDEETVSRSLEALELVLDHGPVLHHHISGGNYDDVGLDPDLPPRLLLVGEAFDLERTQRLTRFCGRQEHAELYELRVLRTGAGESLYLHRLAGRIERQNTPFRRPNPTPPAPAVLSPRGDLLELLSQRLRGLDPALDVRDLPHGRRWNQHGSAGIVHDGPLLEARLEGDGSLTVRLSGGDSERVRSVRELDTFLERVVATYLRGLGGA